jgi:hypothetical protein
MRNYLTVGPVSILISRRHLANWGFPDVKLGGLDFWTRTNDGALNLLAYHPSWSITWLWCINLRRCRYGSWLLVDRARRSQRHHRLRLPFGWSISLWTQRAMPRKR